MSETIYRIDNLTKHYGQFKALDAAELEIGKGKIIGLLGKNGAGKSTPMPSMLGFLRHAGTAELSAAKGSPRKHQTIENDAFIPACSLLLGSIVAMWIVCNEVAWRQMTRDQARIYLRSVLLLSHHAVLRMIVRSRLTSRRKVARELKDVDATPGQLNEKNFAGQNR